MSGDRLPSQHRSNSFRGRVGCRWRCDSTQTTSEIDSYYPTDLRAALIDRTTGWRVSLIGAFRNNWFLSIIYWPDRRKTRASGTAREDLSTRAGRLINGVCMQPVTTVARRRWDCSSDITSKLNSTTGQSHKLDWTPEIGRWSSVDWCTDTWTGNEMNRAKCWSKQLLWMAVVSLGRLLRCVDIATRQLMMSITWVSMMNCNWLMVRTKILGPVSFNQPNISVEKSHDVISTCFYTQKRQSSPNVAIQMRHTRSLWHSD